MVHPHLWSSARPPWGDSRRAVSAECCGLGPARASRRPGRASVGYAAWFVRARERVCRLLSGITAEPALATVSRENNNGRTTVVLSWDFPPAASGMAMLTSPERLWPGRPYTADRDLSQVGRAVLRMIDEDTSGPIELACVVFAADPPQLLEHSWAADTLAWRLSVAGA